jgi:transposase
MHGSSTPSYPLEDRLEARLVDAHHVEHVPGRRRTDRLDAVRLCTVAERPMLRRFSVREWPEPFTA